MCFDNIIRLSDTQLAIIEIALNHLIVDDLEEIDVCPDAAAYNNDRINRSRALMEKIIHPEDIVFRIVEQAVTAVTNATTRNVIPTLQYVDGLSFTVKLLSGRTLNSYGAYRDACANNKVILSDYFSL